MLRLLRVLLLKKRYSPGYGMPQSKFSSPAPGARASLAPPPKAIIIISHFFISISYFQMPIFVVLYTALAGSPKDKKEPKFKR